MENKTIIYRAKRVIMLSFPNGNPESMQSPESFIALNYGPQFARVLEPSWVDPYIHENYERYLKNQFGFATNYKEIQKGEPHIIRESLWLKKPKMGRCFYGLIDTRDTSRLSQGDNIENLTCYYLSYPLESIEDIDDCSLTQICRDESMTSEQKSSKLFEILNHWYCPSK